MPEPYQEPQFSSNAADGETTPRQPPLGLKNPLLPPNVLGQNFLSPKFLSPLGAHPLGADNSLAVPNQALPDYGLLDNSVQDSPFFAESQLSLSNPEPALSVNATSLPTSNSDRLNVQRASVGNEPENSVDTAASEELAVAVERSEQQEALVQRAEEQPQAIASPNASQEEVFTKAEPDLTSPVSQPANPSDSETTDSSVVQPRLTTEHHVQREVATPQAPEAAQLIDSSVGNPQPPSQMPVSSEPPQAIASPNASQEEVFTKAEPDLTSPIPQPANPSESETTDSSVIQPRLTTEHHVQREVATPQAPEAAQSIESSIGNPQPPSQMAISSEQPQVIASPNASQEEVFTKAEADLTSPVTQPANPSESETTDSSVIQPRLTTEHHVQREVATPQAPEAAQSIESSIGNPQPPSQMAISSEQPQVIASPNASQEEVFTKAEADLTSPVTQPANPSESETTASSVVQPRLATEHHIQREIATPQAPEAAQSIESSVENQHPSGEMPVSSEQPQAIANTNDRHEEIFTKTEADLTSPVPQPALSSELDATDSNVVQARLATEPQIQREIATPQAPEATEPIEIQREIATPQAPEAAEPIEPSVENQQPSSQMAVSLEEPQVLANTNDRQEESFTKAEADLTSPVTQPANPSESETTSSSVVQARLATEPHSQREVATPQAPEAAQSIESSVENQQPSSQMAVSSEQPQALTNTNARQEEAFTKAEPDLTSPVTQPANPSESETIDSSIVQARLATEPHVQREIATPQAPEAAQSIESSVENQQPSSQMAVSSEQPQVLANTNDRQEEVFTKAEPNLTSPVSQPANPSESDATDPNVVQPRLATEPHIQKETTPVTQDDSVPYSQQQSVKVAKPDVIPDEIHVAPKLEVALPVADPQQAIADSSSPNALTPVTENPANIPEPAIEQRTSEHDRVSQVAENESLIQQKATEQAIAQPDNSLASARLELGKESATQQLSTATPETAPEGQTPTELAVVQPLLGTEASDLNSQVLPRVSDSLQLPESLPSGESIVQSKAVTEIAARDISSVSPLSDSSGLPRGSEQLQPSESSVTVEATEQTAHDDIKVEAIANSNSVTPVAQGESIVQSKAVPEIATPDISSVSPLSDSSGLPRVSEQQQPPESAEQAAYDTKMEAIANSNSVTPVAQGESILQSKQLPETTTAQAAFAAPLPAEIEPPSTISEPIIAEPAPVIPNTVARESSPDSYPLETETPQSDEKTSLTEPTIVQPRMEGDTQLESGISPTLKNVGKAEESLVPVTEQENSPEATPVPSNSVFSNSPTSTTPPAVSTNLLQRNITRDESFNPNQDVPQLPTVLENLVGSRHAMPLIQPLNQPSQFLTAASTAASSREQPTVLQAMPEISPRRVQSAAPLPLSEETFSNASEQTVQVPPVSLDTQPLTLRRFATDVTHGTTPEPNQHTRPLGSSTPTSDIPTSWSSIAELLGDNTDDSSSTFGSVTSIQRALDDSREQAPLDWQESNSWESIIPEYSRSADSSSTFNQETPIQRFTTEEAPPHEEVSSAEHPSKQEDSKNEDSNSLEMLALEIYGLVRQRLEIERERQGNYYSDRLPW